MNFKSFSIIIALLSFELKVFSIPIDDIISEKEVNAVENLNLEISTNELNVLEISDSEDELYTVYEVDSNLEGIDSDSESDIELETTKVPTNSLNDNKISSELPCSDIQSCVDWMKENKEVLTTYGYPGFTDDIFDYLLLQYQDGKKIEKLQQDFDAINYGMKVEVNGRKMSVNIMGEEHNTTIVVLPGLTCPSPVLFYNSLTEILANDYKVVTIEPFGYGVSDLTDRVRTAENMVSEIHECLQKLGIDQFYFMGHSIGGIYSIVYDNTYQNEVLGFIGLDNTPSNTDEFSNPPFPEDLSEFVKIFDKYHLWGLLPENEMKEYTRTNTEQQAHNYPEEKLNYLITINSLRYDNLNVLDEFNRSEENVAFTKGMYFHCPVLMFISSENDKYLSYWTPTHEHMINDNPNKDLIDKSKMIVLKDSTHALIHTQNKEYISDEIKKWIQ